MRGRWLAMGGLLLLAACRSDGTRGPSLTTETTEAPQGMAAWRTQVSRGHLQGGTRAEQGPTPRAWRMAEALVEAQLAAGRLAEERARTPAVQDYAARLVEERDADLRALTDVAREQALDLEAPDVRRDPIVLAQRQADGEALARLRALDGEALEAGYLTAQPASLSLLAALGEQGERATTDLAIGNVLRMIAQQARERAGLAEGLIPTVCGGRRAPGERP